MDTDNTEVRTLPVDDGMRSFELWPDADYEMRMGGDGLTLEGYAAVFNSPSLPMSFANIEGGRTFREVIQPGAFTRSLNAKPTVYLVVNHDILSSSLPLASTSPRSQTMGLEQDDHGLRVRAGLPDNERGREVRDAIARGVVSGMSFRFSRPVAKIEQGQDGNLLRTLTEVRLGPEVSVTPFPAYDMTSVAVRHLAEEVDAEPDDLSEAFRVLRDPEARLTVEQRDLLMAVVNARTDTPFVGPKVAAYRELLAARA